MTPELIAIAKEAVAIVPHRDWPELTVFMEEWSDGTAGAVFVKIGGYVDIHDGFIYHENDELVVSALPRTLPNISGPGGIGAMLGALHSMRPDWPTPYIYRTLSGSWCVRFTDSDGTEPIIEHYGIGPNHHEAILNRMKALHDS